MEAMLGLAVGEADRRRIRRCVGGNVVAGRDNRGDRRMQRHVVTICPIELFCVVCGYCRVS